MDKDYIQDLSDRELVSNCIEGKSWALGILYKRFRGLIINMIKNTAIRQRVNLSKEDLEDCEQFIWESFLKKDFSTLRRWEERCSLARWIKICSGNATINFMRVKRKFALNEICVGEFFPSIFNTEKKYKDSSLDIDIDNVKIFDEAINIIENDLNDRERQFASLYWYKELSNEKISILMNISKKNLYLLKHRIVIKIKKILKKRLDIL